MYIFRHTAIAHLLNYTMCVCVHAHTHSVESNSLQPHGHLPGSSLHGIFQARKLEWVAISFSTGSSWPRDRTCVSCVSCIGGHVLYQLSVNFVCTGEPRSSCDSLYCESLGLNLHWISTESARLNHKFRELKQYEFLILEFCRSKFQPRSHWVKAKVSAGRVPFWGA